MKTIKFLVVKVNCGTRALEIEKRARVENNCGFRARFSGLTNL
jgi:hypothetical protein